MLRLSVKVNNVFGTGKEPDEMVRLAATAGADAVGYWPWYDEDLDVVADTAADAAVDVAYLSGGSQTVDGPEFPLASPATRDAAVNEIKRAIDVAASVDCEFLNVIPGRRDATLDPAVQHASIVDGLRQVAARAEATGVTVLVEPVNTAVDHPGMYLSASYEGYKIIDAVDSPNVRLLYDVYHQQITEGNLTANLRTHVEEIAHVHIADVPGRREPGTGEINYPNVFAALADAGYDGYVGCEFEPTGDPVEAISAVAELLDGV